MSRKKKDAETFSFEETVKAYLNRPYCPYCLSRKVGATDEPFIDEHDQCRLKITCHNCGKEWDELYGITTIDLTAYDCCDHKS